jgi:hypothetical protein
MKNKFLKNKIALVVVMILLGSFSVALAAPGDAPSRPPVHPGNSSQPVLNLKVGGSNLPSAALDVAGSNALSFFDRVDSFITVFGRLWIGGNTWLGSPSLFSVPSIDPLNPGLISLPIRTLNIVGTFLSSTLSHDGTIAAQRAVCVQNSKLILCTAPAVTYQWDIGAWGACTGSAPGTCTGTYTSGICSGTVVGSYSGDQMPGPYEGEGCGTFNQASCPIGWINHGCHWSANGQTNSCSGATTSSSCTAQGSSCNWNPGTTSIQTRTVVCKDSSNTVVADSLCAQPKPPTTQPCSAVTSCSYYYKVGPITHGCFIKDTMVSLADGTQKPIQDIAIGDVLKGEKTNNTVTGFDRPLLGDKETLYSFNGGEYFVSEDHPFMTTDGWKAINPELAGLKHQLGFNIGKLQEGDTLVGDDSNIVLSSIDSKHADKDTQLYNFILTGDHTYYADGYLVHNKNDCETDGSPSCTAGWTCTGYASLSATQSYPAVTGGGICYKNSTGTPLTCSTPNDTPYTMSSSTSVSPYFLSAPGTYVCYNGVVSFKTATDLLENAEPFDNPPALNYQTAACSAGVGTGTTYTCSGGGWVNTGSTCNDPSAPISNDQYMSPDGYDFFQGDTQCTTSQPGNCSCINVSGPNVSPQPDRC